jgi:DNA polymerase III subunit alpha
MNLELVAPNLNLSEYKFTVNQKGQIVYGLGAIKGVGQAALDDLLAERREHGFFKSLYDLCKRVVNRKVNRRVLESLIKAGAFDSLDDNPAKLFAQLPEALRVAEQYVKTAAAGQNDFFSFAETQEDKEPDYEITHVPYWTKPERLEAEKVTLGLYLTGHPIDEYEAELKNFTSGKIASVLENAEKARTKTDARIAGFIIEIKKFSDRTLLVIDDRSRTLELSLYNELVEQTRDLLVKDNLVIADISISQRNDYGVRVSAKKLYSIEQARSSFAKALFFEWQHSANNADSAFVQNLREILSSSRGACPVVMRYKTKTAVANIGLGDNWRVNLTDALLAELQRFPSIRAVEVKYQ